MAPLIQRQLAASGQTARDIGLIVLTNGPGSFTGIRIGLAMGRGLALALNVPLAACSTFDAVLQNLPPQPGESEIILAIDSRHRERLPFISLSHGVIARCCPQQTPRFAAHARQWLRCEQLCRRKR